MEKNQQLTEVIVVGLNEPQKFMHPQVNLTRLAGVKVSDDSRAVLVQLKDLAFPERELPRLANDSGIWIRAIKIFPVDGKNNVLIVELINKSDIKGMSSLNNRTRSIIRRLVDRMKKEKRIDAFFPGYTSFEIPTSYICYGDDPDRLSDLAGMFIRGPIHISGDNIFFAHANSIVKSPLKSVFGEKKWEGEIVATLNNSDIVSFGRIEESCLLVVTKNGGFALNLRNVYLSPRRVNLPSDATYFNKVTDKVSVVMSGRRIKFVKTACLFQP